MPYDKIIIITNSENFQGIKLDKDSKYKQVKQAQADGTLPEPKGYCAPRAAYQHKPQMLEEIVVYDTGETERRIKSSLLVHSPADSMGRIEFEMEDRAEAERVFRALKAIDKNVTTDPYSALSEEELMPPPAPPRNKGGRGNKARKVVEIRSV